MRVLKTLTEAAIKANFFSLLLGSLVCMDLPYEDDPSSSWAHGSTVMPFSWKSAPPEAETDAFLHAFHAFQSTHSYVSLVVYSSLNSFSCLF